jgi:hypothetical protein
MELALVNIHPGGDPLDPPFCCTELHLVNIIVVLVNVYLGGDPLDPPFRYMELHLVYVIVESTNEVPPVD